MNGKIKAAVVGCGVMGVRHLATIAASQIAEPYALADLIEERRTESAVKYGAKKVFTEGADLVTDPDVEAVIFATPAANRDELAIAALEAGKHVLVEKPVATSARVVERMIAAKGDLVAGCCSGRYHRFESARTSAEFVAGGALGDLRTVHCRVHGPASGPPKGPPPEWRLKRSMNGGGILMNWGCYDVDYLLGICGWKLVPRLAFAQTWEVPPMISSHIADGSDAETHLTALVKCEGGTVISFERGEYMPAHAQQEWQIVGSKGALNLNMMWDDDKVVNFDELTTDGVVTKPIWRGSETWDMMQGFIIEDFLQAVAEGRESQTSLEKALVVQKIFDAIYQSAAEGNAVEIV